MDLRRMLDDAAEAFDAGRLDEAERLFRATLARVPEGANRLRGECLQYLADLARGDGRCEDAREGYRAALDAWDRVRGARREQAECRRDLARIEAELERFGPAARAFQEAARLIQGLTDGDLLAAESWTEAGECLLLAGDASGSAECYRRAFALVPASADHRLLRACCHAGIGSALRALDRPGDALVAYRAAVGEVGGRPRDEHDARLLALLWTAIGETYGVLGDVEESVDAHRRGLASARAGGDAEVEWQCLVEIAALTAGADAATAAGDLATALTAAGDSAVRRAEVLARAGHRRLLAHDDLAAESLLVRAAHEQEEASGPAEQRARVWGLLGIAYARLRLPAPALHAARMAVAVLDDSRESPAEAGDPDASDVFRITVRRDLALHLERAAALSRGPERAAHLREALGVSLLVAVESDSPAAADQAEHIAELVGEPEVVAGHLAAIALLDSVAASPRLGRVAERVLAAARRGRSAR